MHASDELRILSWPFHNGLGAMNMGSGPIRLARDDEFRAGIEAEGWRMTDEEIDAVDPDLDTDDRTLAAARSVAREIASGIRSQPTSATG